MRTDGADPARLLAALQRLLEIPAADLRTALTHACNAIADALSADKVDAFLYDPARDSLVAEGTSTQPLSALQRSLGLDVLPLSNGGRVVYVYKTEQVYRTGNLQADPDELRGVKEGLRIESKMGIPLHVGPRLRGMVMIASLKRDYFTEADESFATSMVRWVGVVAHRAELVRDIERNAVEHGRRAAAEEVVTVLAHDLRDYIAPIATRLYMLRHRAEAEKRAEDLAHASAALRGVSSLSGLISNLLDMARLDRGLFELDTQPVDLATLAREAAAILSTAEHAILVESYEPVLAMVDAARLRQCLHNLLGNALNHSPKGAPVTVIVSCVNDLDRTWGQLEIIDEGPGIPEAILPRIFEPFATGRAKQGGLGVGLYLAKRIAVAHGGDVKAEQREGAGARFVVRIPAQRGADLIE